MSKKAKNLSWKHLRSWSIPKLLPVQNSNDIDVLLEQAEQSRGPLEKLGIELATLANGEFFMGPNKKREIAEAYLQTGKNGIRLTTEPSHLTDYVRGTILVDGVQGIQQFQRASRHITDTAPQARIVRVRDFYAKPTYAGLRGIFLDVVLDNGHIGEVVVQERQYYQQLKPTHALFKQITALAALPSRTDEEEDLLNELAYQRAMNLRRIADQTNVTGLSLRENPEHNVSCAFPIRHLFHAPSDQNVSIMATSHHLSIV